MSFELRNRMSAWKSVIAAKEWHDFITFRPDPTKHTVFTRALPYQFWLFWISAIL